MDNNKKTQMIRMDEVDQWSNLPTEILQLILVRLPFLDHLSFRRVCRNWRSASSQSPPGTHPPSQRPWLMSLKQNSRGTIYELLDSSTQSLYNIEIPELIGTKHFMTRHGWLLLGDSNMPSKLSHFFFNPFSRARIDLPLLNLTPYSISNLDLPLFSISAPPTSRNCIVFVVISHIYMPGVTIGICRRGEDEWTVKEYGNEEVGPITTIVFHKGLFYCADFWGGLWAFDATCSSWHNFRRPEGDNYFSYAVEHDGKVVMSLDPMIDRNLSQRFFILDDCRHGKPLKEIFFPKGWEMPGVFDLPKGDLLCGSHWGILNKSEEVDGTCMRGVLIEPMWIQPSASLGWTS